MIPILYEKNTTSFLNNGLGRLSDAISCKVTEERNGTFELTMTYPISGIHYHDIEEERIIFARSEDGGNPQAFIIYKISKPLNGVVTINAEHISYLLNGYVVMPFTATSLADALGKINANAVLSTGFTFATTIVENIPYKLELPRSIRSLLGGERGSLLDVYGGKDYKFDNFTVTCYGDRGADNGVTIRYGKNLTDLKAVNDATNIYTGIVPYWQDSDTGATVYVDDYVVYGPHAATYPYSYIKVVDFSDDFEEAPTKAQLLLAATNYLDRSDGWKIKNTIKVSFVNLSQSEEYKDIAPLERVKLCDTVTVQYTKLGVSFKTKVIKTVYDVLLDRYDSIELGDTTYSLAKAIQEVNQTQTVSETKTAIQTAVNRATELIRGGLGGHVVMMTDGNGKPQEILIMDTEDITTAQKVWRWNLNGLGYSSTGYDGTYGLAITMNGEIVADYITAGTLDGGLIRAGSISANAFNVDTKLQLDILHDYFMTDIWGNIANWTGNAPHSYGTYSGKKALIIDGTNVVTPYDDRIKTLIDATGDIKYTVSLTFYIDVDFYCSVDTYIFAFNFYRSNGNPGYWRYGFDAGTDLHAGEPITVSFDYYLNGIDRTKGDATFCIVPIIGRTIYVTDIKLYTTAKGYEQATFTFNIDGLSSSVQKDDVISSINQSAEAVTIDASRIDLTGNLSLHGDFTAYDTNDNTNYIDLSDGEISVYNQGSNVFTVASYPLAGSNAGIFFGDKDDASSLTRYTNIDQDCVRTPCIWARLMDTGTTPTGNTVAYFEGDTVVTSDGTFATYGWAHIRGKAQFFDNVYNSGGSVVFVSDKRKKKNIKDIVTDKAKEFIMNLKPRQFKFKEGTSGRYHHGFVAQEVKEAMQEDWGVYIDDKEMDFIGLRYDELLADMVAVIQDQEKRISALERRLNDNAET